jgi:pimeloyl-ACP methyl ester carboxylesterase
LSDERSGRVISTDQVIMGSASRSSAGVRSQIRFREPGLAAPLSRAVARPYADPLRRGNGLSDREVKDVSLETFVSDLEAVVDAAGLERFALFGISQGCAISIAYAVRHPERVTHLILLGGFALGPEKRAQSEAEKEQAAAMLTLMRLGWGQENPAFRQLFTSRFIPGATKEQADWFN